MNFILWNVFSVDGRLYYCHFCDSHLSFVVTKLGFWKRTAIISKNHSSRGHINIFKNKEWWLPVCHPRNLLLFLQNEYLKDWRKKKERIYAYLYTFVIVWALNLFVLTYSDVVIEKSIEICTYYCVFRNKK